jgi:hypothetical protein
LKEWGSIEFVLYRKYSQVDVENLSFYFSITATSATMVYGTYIYYVLLYAVAFCFQWYITSIYGYINWLVLFSHRVSILFSVKLKKKCWHNPWRQQNVGQKFVLRQFWKGHKSSTALCNWQRKQIKKG